MSAAGFTIPIPIPARTAWYRKTEWMASRTGSLPRNEKEMLLTPPLTMEWGNLRRSSLVASM